MAESRRPSIPASRSVRLPDRELLGGNAQRRQLARGLRQFHHGQWPLERGCADVDRRTASSWTAGGIDLVAGQTLTNNGTFTIGSGLGRPHDFRRWHAVERRPPSTRPAPAVSPCPPARRSTMRAERTTTPGRPAPCPGSVPARSPTPERSPTAARGALTISIPFVNQGGTLDAASGTLSIQSTNCTWTGGRPHRRHRRHPATGTGAWQRDHPDRHVYRLGRGPGAVQAAPYRSAPPGRPSTFPRACSSGLAAPSAPNQGGALTNTGFLTLSNASGVTLNAAEHGDQPGRGRPDRRRQPGDQRRDLRQPGRGDLQHQRHRRADRQRHVFRRGHPQDDRQRHGAALRPSPA